MVPVPAAVIARLLYESHFGIDLRGMSREDILNSTERLHEFIPNQVLYEYAGQAKQRQVVRKERIKFRQALEPELQRCVFLADWGKRLDLGTLDYKIVQETFSSLYNSVNPFMDCVYESDVFEESEAVAVDKYLTFITEFVQRDLNANYTQAYESAAQFMQAIVLYGKSLDLHGGLIPRYTEIVGIMVVQERFQEQTHLLLDSLLIKLNLNMFINSFIMPYIDLLHIQNYVIRRLAMIFSAVGIRDINDRLCIEDERIVGIIDSIYANKHAKYEALFNYINQLDIKNDKFSLFASLRKMSYYLIKECVVKVLGVEEDDQLISLLKCVYK